MDTRFTFTISYDRQTTRKSVRSETPILAECFFTFNLNKVPPDRIYHVDLQIFASRIESDYTKYYEEVITKFFNLDPQQLFIGFLKDNGYIARSTRTLTFNPAVFETNITDDGGRTIFTVTISKPPPKGKVSISSGKMPRFCVEIWQKALSSSNYNDQVRDKALTICPGQDLTDPNHAGVYTYQTNDNSFFQFRRCEVSQLHSSGESLAEVYNLLGTDYALNDFLMSSAVDGIHDQNNVKPSQDISEINTFKTSIQSLVMRFIEDKLRSFECREVTGNDIEDAYAHMVSCVTNTSLVIADEADNSPGASSDPAAASSEPAMASVHDYHSSTSTEGMTSSATFELMSNQVSFLANNSTYFPNITTNDATPFQLMDTGVSLVVNEFTNLYIKATNCKFIFHDGSIEILMCFDFKQLDNGTMELYYVVVYNITIGDNSYIFKTYTQRDQVNSNYNHYVKMNRNFADISANFRPDTSIEQLILFVGISMGKTNNDLLQFLSAIGVNNSCSMVFFGNGVPTSALPSGVVSTDAATAATATTAAATTAAATTAAAAAPSADPASVTLNHTIIDGINFEDLLEKMLNSSYFGKVKLSWYFIANDRVNISMINYLTYMIKQTGNFPLSTYLKSVNFGSIHTYRGTLISYISSGAGIKQQTIVNPLNIRDEQRKAYNKSIKNLYFTKRKVQMAPRTFINEPCSEIEDIDKIIVNISKAESVCDVAIPEGDDRGTSLAEGAKAPEMQGEDLSDVAEDDNGSTSPANSVEGAKAVDPNQSSSSAMSGESLSTQDPRRSPRPNFFTGSMKEQPLNRKIPFNKANTGIPPGKFSDHLHSAEPSKLIRLPTYRKPWRGGTLKNPGGGNRKRRIKKTKRMQKSKKSKKTIKRKTKQNRKTLKRKNKYKKHT